MPAIAFAVLPHALASSIVLPTEMLQAAEDQSRAQRQPPRLSVRIAATTPGRIAATGGLDLNADCDFSALLEPVPDLLILPALWRNPLHTLRRARALITLLQSLAHTPCIICAVGTSSFLLAEAGLLDHRPATTHWFYLDLFTRRYPAVELKRHHLITQAERIYCAGSVNSVADLTVHFIEQFYGPERARHVEAQFSPEIRQPFESRRFAQGHEDRHHDEIVIAAQTQLRANVAKPVSVTRLARDLDISVRSLNRRFKQATGKTPSAYLQQQRISAARDLLRTSNLSIGDIAAQVGFQDTSYFCKVFKRELRQTPAAYRQAVRAKLFSV